MSEGWTVNSEQRLGMFLQHVSDLYAKHKYIRFGIKTGRDRTLDQNALSFQLYTDLHRAKRDTYPRVNDARAHCKLHYGIPIRRQEPEFNDVYCRFIKNRFTYEEKLELMVDPKIDFPVTRDMDKAQFSEFVEEIKRAFPDVHFRPFDI